MYLPHRAQVLYLRGLRRFMDYESGIVGDRRRVSLQQMRECLEVNPDNESSSPRYQPTNHEIRASLEQLVRAGLIQRLQKRSKFDPMRFLLPLASIRQNSQPQENRKGTTARHDALDTMAYAQGGAREPQGHNRIPPVSGKDNTPHRARALILPDFDLTPATRARMKRAGCRDWTADDVLHFIAKNQSSGWQSADWQAEAFAEALRIKNRAATGQQRHSNAPKTGSQLIGDLAEGLTK